MDAYTTLEVIDPNGWRKEYSLEKAIVFIGSDLNNDILLEVEHGAGISPRHLQVIAVPDGGFRLVNLGESAVAVGQEPPHELPPHLSAELLDGDLIKVGEFQLTFRGSVWAAAGSRGHRSQNISINLAMPATELRPHQSLEGHVTITNLGDYAGAQFEVELTGFDPACFELEPGPLLSSGATKEVYFRLAHKGDQPLAGDATITIRVTAPSAYPGEQTNIAQVIRVMPYFAHRLTLPDRTQPRPQVKPESAARSPQPARASERPAIAPPQKTTPAPGNLWQAGEKSFDTLVAERLPAAPAVPAPPVSRPEPPPEPAPIEAEIIEAPPPEPAPIPEIVIKPPVEPVEAESRATVISRPEPAPAPKTEPVPAKPVAKTPVKPEPPVAEVAEPPPPPKPKPKPPVIEKPAPRPVEPAEPAKPRMDWWTPAASIEEAPPATDLWSTAAETEPPRPETREKAVKLKAKKPAEPEKSTPSPAPDTEDWWAAPPETPETDEPDEEQ